MSSFRWTRADETAVFHCCPDHTKKKILFARTYTPRRGFSFSETNNLILNLKIRPSEITRNPNRQQYKDAAIQKFATEVSELLSTPSSSGRPRIIVPMPPSKIRSDPDYDDRTERVAAIVAQNCRGVAVVPILRRSANIVAAHSNEHSRSADAMYNSLLIDVRLKPQIPENSALILLDDVITSGSTFEGARRRLNEEFPGAIVVGIFWAKSQIDAASDFDPL